MGENTKIEWCMHSRNFWTGCHQVSPGCDHCYAAMNNQRWEEGRHWGPPATTPRLLHNLESCRRDFRRWDRMAALEGRPALVFVNSHSDFWEPHPQVAAHRAAACEMFPEYPHLRFLLLTKRPELISHLAPPAWMAGDWPANVWQGTTIEDQKRAERRLPHLFKCPAPVLFASCEPLLECVDIRPWLYSDYDKAAMDSQLLTPVGGFSYRKLGWAIVGGESGPRARPMHPEWVDFIRLECDAAAVPFFFKQWGEWGPPENVQRQRGFVQTATWFGGRWVSDAEHLEDTGGHVDNEPTVYRIGKVEAGHLLNGVEYREWPKEAIG